MDSELKVIRKPSVEQVILIRTRPLNHIDLNQPKPDKIKIPDET